MHKATLKTKWRVYKGVFHLEPTSIRLWSWYTWKPLTRESKVISKAPPVASPVSTITVCRASTCFTPRARVMKPYNTYAFRFSWKFCQFISLRIYFLQKFRWTPNWSILWKFQTTKIWSYMVTGTIFCTYVSLHRQLWNSMITSLNK